MNKTTPSLVHLDIERSADCSHEDEEIQMLGSSLYGDTFVFVCVRLICHPDVHADHVKLWSEPRVTQRAWHPALLVGVKSL